MTGEVVFLPGQFTDSSGILARFLPPVSGGTVDAWLRENITPGAWILDPFGTSPRAIIEAAQAGYRVFVTANNPIDRLIIDLLAAPPDETELRTALAGLGSAHKGDERLEPHIRGLYKSTCIQCSQPVMVESYVWQRDAKTPSQRIFHCQNCGRAGEFPVTKDDEILANQFAGSSQLHRARALERVTPLDDPDRPNVEEALDVYLPRAIYALFSIINKLESIPDHQRRSVTALLISAFDQANNLWPYPPARTRPRQLSNPTVFREMNVWCALENAYTEWVEYSVSFQNPVTVTTWPDSLTENSGIMLYPGRLKDLAGVQTDLQFDAVLAVMPRYNQAYWTLSTLWAGWLGGRQNVAQFKTVLRRRRYDWNWHIGALQAALNQLNNFLDPATAILGLIGEASPEFLTASLLSGRLARLNLVGAALRSDQDQAQIRWQTPSNGKAASSQSTDDQILGHGASSIQNRLRELFIAAGKKYLVERGEPSRYSSLLCACLSAAVLAPEFELLIDIQASELMADVNAALQQALSYQNGFMRFGGSPNTLDIGWWWLSGQQSEMDFDISLAAEVGVLPTVTPLVDRVEMEVVRYISSHPNSTLFQLDQAICRAFPGLLTPDRGIVEACLASYAEAVSENKTSLSLREVDQPKNRRADLATLIRLLLEFGRTLGYQTEVISEESRHVIWKNADEPPIEFHLVASAVISKFLTNSRNAPTRSILVYPGSRAGLISYKLEQNPQMKKLIERGWRLVKFRHIRRLAENEKMTAASFMDQIDLDPVSNRDQQIALL